MNTHADNQQRLAHLSVAVRPNVSVCTWPTEAGTKALETYRPIEDATVVKRLREQGARLTGIPRMSEMGFGVVSDTSPMMLSENKCDVALGTDLTGESRYLATMAGAWGYKPSFGICSNLGLITLAPSLETVGIAANTPAAIAGVLSAISGKDDRDFSMLWDPLPDFAAAASKKNTGIHRIGFLSEQINRLDESEKQAFYHALDALSQKGIETAEIAFPDEGLFRLVHQVVGATEASSSAGKYDGVRYGHRAQNAANWNDMYLSTRQESFGALVKAYLFQGAYFQFKNYGAFTHACRLRHNLVKKIRGLFENVDFIASPVRLAGRDATRAACVSDVYDAFALTLMANVGGLPALSVPGMVKAGDMDLGFQLTAAHGSDEKLLHFAMSCLAAAC